MLRSEERAESRPKTAPRREARAIQEGEKEWVEVPLVPFRARAGFLSGFGDPVWPFGKNTIPVMVDRRLQGDYVLFEVEGDSMEDGTMHSFLEGDVLLCRVHPISEWDSSIKKRNDTICVIVTEDEGIVIKQVIKHDRSTRTLTLHSFNEAYEDYEVSLDKVLWIFYVEELNKRRLL